MSKERFAYLSWNLLEAKICYYGFFFIQTQSPYSDEEYDLLCREYLDLCRYLDQPNLIVHDTMAGYEDIETSEIQPDINRPSVNLAVTKLMKRQDGIL